MLKWVENGDSTSPSPVPSDSASGCREESPLQRVKASGAVNTQASPVSIVSIKTRGVAGGGSYGLFRLHTSPKRSPTTTADRLAAQLVRHLQGPQRQVLLGIAYFEFLPNRLGRSAALRDCVGLFCSAMSHCQRGTSAVGLVHLVAEPYGKAIRSVQRAINDPHEQLRPETVAAICVLERFDVLFNVYRKPHRSLHGQGICHLMYKKGPPNLNDDLDTRLALESQTTLLPYWISDGGHNFFLDENWSDAMDASRQKLVEADKAGFLDRSFGMDRISNYWPAFMDESRNIHANRLDPDIGTRVDALLKRLEGLRTEIEDLGGDVVDKASQLGLMAIVEAPKCPGGYAYDFFEPYLFDLVAGYYLLKILFIKMTIDMSAIKGPPADWLQVELERLCRGVCMLAPYILQLGPIASKLTATAFYLCYPLAPAAESEFCLQFIVDSDRYMNRLPKDPEALKEHMLLVFRGIVGHIQFPNVEEGT